jgi:hypothetical protein
MINLEKRKRITINAGQYKALMGGDLRIEDMTGEIGKEYTMVSNGLKPVTAICVNTFDFGENSRAAVFCTENIINKLKNNSNL